MAEAKERAENAERLKTPLVEDSNKRDPPPNPATEPPAPQETGDTTPKSPIGTQPEDLEVLPDARVIPYNMQEGEAATTSLDCTLSEEGEGDNINGNKKLRKEEEDEDENSSKRAKVPQPIETT